MSPEIEKTADTSKGVVVLHCLKEGKEYNLGESYQVWRGVAEYFVARAGNHPDVVDLHLNGRTDILSLNQQASEEIRLFAAHSGLFESSDFRFQTPLKCCNCSPSCGQTPHQFLAEGRWRCDNCGNTQVLSSLPENLFNARPG